jgi:hypothetical protein
MVGGVLAFILKLVTFSCDVLPGGKSPYLPLKTVARTKLDAAVSPGKLSFIVTRWWFILLAVVLSWFTPAHAFAHTRASQAAYDVGPALEKVVLVAGITMDTYQGDNQDPLSLHKFLYCEANPANGTDPSGRLLEEPLLVLSADVFTRTKDIAGSLAVKRLAQRTIIKSIASLLAGTLVLFDPAEDDGEDGIPTMFYSKSDFPVIAPKISSLQANHPFWALLHYIGSGEGWSKIQRQMALKKVSGKDPGTGNSWDEYPFASTFEGGEPADVQPAPITEQSKQAIKHRQFYNDNHLRMGDPFFVKVVP